MTRMCGPFYSMNTRMLLSKHTIAHPGKSAFSTYNLQTSWAEPMWKFNKEGMG